MSRYAQQELGAGILRHWLTLEAPATGQDAAGQPNTGFRKVGRLRAEIIATSGGEYVRGQQMEAGVTSLVTIRYRRNVTTDMRLVTCDGRHLNIVKAVDVEGRREWLSVQCKEIAP